MDGAVRLACLVIVYKPRPMTPTCNDATAVRLDCVESGLCPV
jgi:hypothetical protein